MHCEMSELSELKRRDVIVGDRLGMHAGPAMGVANAVKSYGGGVYVEKVDERGRVGEKRYDAGDVMDLMQVCAPQGTRLRFSYSKGGNVDEMFGAIGRALGVNG
jgi:phosphotransferase system HPr-like phosphotransfer protein